MKRIILVLSVALVMAVMMVVMAVPAFAYEKKLQGTNSQGSRVGFLSSESTHNGQGPTGIAAQAQAGKRSDNVQNALGH